MDTRRGEHFKRIIELSEQMLEQARASQWERVAELEVERKQVVLTCFQQPASSAEAPDMASNIRRILVLNDEISSLCGEYRAQIGDQLHTRKVGASASAAYLSYAP